MAHVRKPLGTDAEQSGCCILWKHSNQGSVLCSLTGSQRPMSFIAGAKNVTFGGSNMIGPSGFVHDSHEQTWKTHLNNPQVTHYLLILITEASSAQRQSAQQGLPEPFQGRLKIPLLAKAPCLWNISLLKFLDIPPTLSGEEKTFRNSPSVRAPVLKCLLCGTMWSSWRAYLLGKYRRLVPLAYLIRQASKQRDTFGSCDAN